MKKDDEFVSADDQQKEEGKSKNKKRKRALGEDQNETRLSAARGLCSSAAEFTLVSKFTQRKLETWI